MRSLQVSISRTGQVAVDGLAYPYYVEVGNVHGDENKTHWYLQRYLYSHRSFAWHNRRKDLIAAIGVFLDGAPEPGAGQTEHDCITRALQLCLETGSRNVVPLRDMPIYAPLRRAP